jgi:hypothetical protein
MTSNPLTGKMLRSPLFYALLAFPSVYPVQLIFTDYLTREYVVVPVRETAALYALGVVAYLYGMTAPYTYETDTKRKSGLKCMVALLGATILFINFAWTSARWCLGVGGACG